MKKIFLLLFIAMMTVLSGCNKYQQANNSNLLLDSKIIEPSLKNSSVKFRLKNTIDISSYIDIDKYKSYYCVGYNENKIYYILFNMNNSFTLCYFELEKEEIKYIKENLYYDFLINTFVFNENIYLVTNKIQENGKLSLDIFKINETNQTNILNLSDTLKMPFISILNDSICLMIKEENDNKYFDIVYTFDIETSELKKIDEKYYIQNDDNTYTGNSIVCMGGIDDTVYYEVMELNNNVLERGEGVPHIYSYSLKEKKKNNINYNFDKPLNFIAGDNNYVFTSNYNYYTPENNSGKLFNLKNKQCIYIPYINISEDILNIKKLNEENYLIFNGKKILIYNTVNNNFESIVSDDYYKSNIILKDNIMLFSYSFDEKILTSIYEYNKPKFSKKLDSDLTEKLNYKLVDSYIDPLYKEDQNLYYLETSNYKYRPYEKSEAIIWYYNINTGFVKELYSFELFYYAKSTYDDKYIYINDIASEGELFNIKINIKTGEIEIIR